MSDIRYVCLSDLHLGEEDSLLTNLDDCTKASPVLTKLVECIKHLVSKNKDQIQKPKLILNGDILELALETTDNALMGFERFVELIMPKDYPLFDKEIIYLPGNHDHHLWELARESQYVDYLKNETKPGQILKVPCHTSKMFHPTTGSYLLNSLIQRSEHMKDTTLTAAYPNYGFTSKDSRKCVIFHHGHFTESLYKLMSRLRTLVTEKRKMPSDVCDIEAENFAWIDFFWSTMGRSGEMGKNIERIYEKTQDPKQFKKLLSILAKNLANDYDLPGPGDYIEEKVLNRLFSFIANKVGLERHKSEGPLSKNGREGLEEYINGPVKNQIMGELSVFPRDMTFIFSHTHKPMQESVSYDQYLRPVKIYNTGGWTVDTTKPDSLHGGVVILIDEELNTVSVHMYHEGEKGIKVEVATDDDKRGNSLYDCISKTVQYDCKEHFDAFSDMVALEVKIRAKNLDDRIKEAKEQLGIKP